VSAWEVGAAPLRPIDRDSGGAAATPHVLNAAETQHACVLATRRVCAPLVCNGRSCGFPHGDRVGEPTRQQSHVGICRVADIYF